MKPGGAHGTYPRMRPVAIDQASCFNCSRNRRSRIRFAASCTCSAGYVAFALLGWDGRLCANMSLVDEMRLRLRFWGE